MRALLAGLLLALAMLAAAPATAQEPRRVDPSIADGSAKRALERARTRWRTARIGSYAFELRRSCFCPPSEYRRLVVVDGRPRNPPAALAKLATVPRLHRQIRLAIERRHSRLRVTYGRYGVPTSIEQDPDSRVADEESSYAIRRFARR